MPTWNFDVVLNRQNYPLGLTLLSTWLLSASLFLGVAVSWNGRQWHGHGISIPYFSLAPRYVKSPPQRIISHQVEISENARGQNPWGVSYSKKNVSPVSNPSRQFLALPSTTSTVNAQSSKIHLFIFVSPWRYWRKKSKSSSLLYIYQAAIHRYNIRFYQQLYPRFTFYRAQFFANPYYIKRKCFRFYHERTFFQRYRLCFLYCEYVK